MNDKEREQLLAATVQSLDNMAAQIKLLKEVMQLFLEVRK